MKNKKPVSAISVTDDYFKKIDLSSKKEKILHYLQKIHGLKLKSYSSLWESRYWGKGVGAFQIEGEYSYKDKKTPVIIKIQGLKPNISEAKIINYLKKIESDRIKFPNTVFYKPWNKKLGCEIIFFEKNQGGFYH